MVVVMNMVAVRARARAMNVVVGLAVDGATKWEAMDKFRYRGKFIAALIIVPILTMTI